MTGKLSFMAHMTFMTVQRFDQRNFKNIEKKKCLFLKIL